MNERPASHESEAIEGADSRFVRPTAPPRFEYRSWVPVLLNGEAGASAWRLIGFASVKTLDRQAISGRPLSFSIRK